MKASFIACLIALLIAFSGLIFLSLRANSLSEQVAMLQSIVPALHSSAASALDTYDAPPNRTTVPSPIIAAVQVNVSPLATVSPDAHDTQPGTPPSEVVPVRVVSQRNTLHPGLAYDIYNDGTQPLNLRIILTNPLHMTKLFDCHVEPGKGSYCELGFNQGFSGGQGDTLTIQALNYLPLIVTPQSF